MNKRTELESFRALAPFAPRIAEWESYFFPKRFDRGEYLWWEGQPAECFTLLVRGGVKVLKTRADGGQTILSLFGPGEFVGHGAVYRKLAYPASAVTMSEVEVLQIHRRHMAEIWEAVPAIRDLLVEEVLACNFRLVQRIHDLSVNAAEQRMALLFTQLAEKWGTTDDQHVVHIPHLSRGELADLVNIREETAIRLMRRWHTEGIVETHSDGFVVTDQDQLDQLCWVV